eukprot:750847-Amphidinium_carterae.1
MLNDIFAYLAPREATARCNSSGWVPEITTHSCKIALQLPIGSFGLMTTDNSKLPSQRVCGTIRSKQSVRSCQHNHQKHTLENWHFLTMLIPGR